MESVFGPEELNLTAKASLDHIAKVYTAEEIALILGALGAMVASIIYSVKNIKHSSCCLGLFECNQRTELPVSKDSIILESRV
tara:strand:- start:209 stop:457 length:249 start_codon:yes stop_codon:yes gene_type:complete